MTIDPNPYASPKEPVLPNLEGGRLKRSRKVSALLGSCIGLSIGIIWTLIFGPLTDGPPSIRLSFLMYTTGFAATGFVVGIVQRSPVLVGAIAGSVIMSTWVYIVGPHDGWIVMWMIFIGGSGLVWGSVIGMIVHFLPKVGGKSV
jgi:hypothetical protein